MSIVTKPMLAPNEPYHPDMKVKWPMMATPKLDGIRCLRLDQKTLSRKFKPIPNLHTQQMMSVLPDGLDGELIVEGFTFNQIQSAVMSEDGNPDIRYYVFDYVSSSLTEEYQERMKKLEKLTLPSWCVKVLPKLVNNEKELDEFEAECLDKGFEGAMLRTPESVYKCGRTTVPQATFLKVKRFLDSEAEVIGFVEQMTNTNEAEIDELGHTKRSKAKEGLIPAGTLGKLLVREVGNTPWKGEEFGVGSGFDAAERAEIWANQDKYLGKIVTYKYQPHGIKKLPRIPIWKGFRSRDDL